METGTIVRFEVEVQCPHCSQKNKLKQEELRRGITECIECDEEFVFHLN